MPKKLLAIFATLAVSAFLVAGCAENPESTNTTVSKSGDAGAKAPTTDASAADATKAGDASKADATKGTDAAKADDATKDATSAGPKPFDKPKDGDEVAVLDTSKGKIVLAFMPTVAPNHVKNFKDLVSKKFYDGTRFHRCIDGFMIQGGDPNSKDLGKADMWGTGGYKENGKERQVNAEFNSTHHSRGILSMARSGDPNSASSQFFIMTTDHPDLDGQYSAFGYVVDGLDVVDQIVPTGDPNQNGKVEPSKAVVVKSARLEKWPIK